MISVKIKLKLFNISLYFLNIVWNNICYTLFSYTVSDLFLNSTPFILLIFNNFLNNFLLTDTILVVIFSFYTYTQYISRFVASYIMQKQIRWIILTNTYVHYIYINTTSYVFKSCLIFKHCLLLQFHTILFYISNTYTYLLFRKLCYKMSVYLSVLIM